MAGRRRLWLVVILVAIVGGLAFAIGALHSTPDAPDPPCSQSRRGRSLLQAEAEREMNAYLAAAGIRAEVQIREEGSFMLGAYPRAQVLWSIRISEPTMAVDDPRLKKAALAAFCLRRGWVWLNSRTPQGTIELISFSTGELTKLAEE